MNPLPADTLVVCTGGSVARLLDTLKARAGLDSDRTLACMLRVQPPVISRLRNGARLGDSTILRIHETFGLPVAEIRSLAGAVRRAV